MINKVVGKPINRIDGRLKVTGKAHYTAEYDLENLTYAALVQSTIAKGRVSSINTEKAEQAAGVLAIITHQNVPQLHQAPAEYDLAFGGVPGEQLVPLQDDRVHYNGQILGIVVAKTLEIATHAAALVQVTYEEQEPTVEIEQGLQDAYYPERFYAEELQVSRGNTKTPSALELGQLVENTHERGSFDQGLVSADVTLEETYTTPVENHHPMEPHATIAVWDGAHLTLYEGTQWVMGARKVVAHMLGVPQENVRIISPFVGGGFGSKGITWGHAVLAAVAARQVGCPVKVVLTRQQMSVLVGHRPRTIQHIALSATANGKLTSIRHAVTTHSSVVQDYIETCGFATYILYACPNMQASHHVVRVNTGGPCPMRAPGEATGLFALESAMDELAYKIGIDPIELRLINHAEVNPHNGLPWSRKHLKECYRRGAEAFGWNKRNPQPRSMRDGRYLIGYGMATATYPGYRMTAEAKVRVLADGTAIVSSASADIGTGTYTILAQIAAESLGLPIEKVRVELGDSSLPQSPASVGALTAVSVGSAVRAAAEESRTKLINMAIADTASPLYGCALDTIETSNGRLSLLGDSTQNEAYEEVLKRSGYQEIVTITKQSPGDEWSKYSFQTFGAQFAKVSVDEQLGRVRVTQMIGVYDVGRVLNHKTARSQMIGGMIFGIGVALMEETLRNPDSGRVVTRTLADYHVPVHADVPKIDIHFIDEPDPHFNVLGAMGIGEIGNAGASAAIANAIYHATGKRIRDLPITPEKLL